MEDSGSNHAKANGIISVLLRKVDTVAYSHSRSLTFSVYNYNVVYSDYQHFSLNFHIFTSSQTIKLPDAKPGLLLQLCKSISYTWAT